MTTPTLPQPAEPALLADYLNPNLTLFDLADRHNLDIQSLIAWSERPDTTALLSRIKSFAETRAAILSADHTPAAVVTLSITSSAAIAASNESADPTLRLRAIESARKAASHLLRLAPRPRKKVASVQANTAKPVPAPDQPVELAEPSLALHAETAHASPAPAGATCQGPLSPFRAFDLTEFALNPEELALSSDGP